MQTDTTHIKEVIKELEIHKFHISDDLSNPNAPDVIEDAITLLSTLADEEFRFKLIKDIKKVIEEKEGNIMTVYCLVATMNNEELKQFHNELLKN